MVTMAPWPRLATTAPTTAVVAPTAPTDRSKPPEIIMTAMPQATMPMMAFCSRMFSRLTEERNVGDTAIRMLVTSANTSQRPKRLNRPLLFALLFMPTRPSDP